MPELPPAPTPWIDGQIGVGESAISGRGLFALEPLETGRVVIRLGGRLVSTSELSSLLRDAPEFVDTLTIYDDHHLVLPAGTVLHYGNHSCDPTLWHSGAHEIAVRRPVAAGTELTIDYATHTGAPGFTMACTCGASSCRGAVTSDDWRLPALQTAYAGHWTPALEERIRSTAG